MNDETRTALEQVRDELKEAYMSGGLSPINRERAVKAWGLVDNILEVK